MPSEVVSRDAWLAARRELLIREKAHTHERAELARLRRELPRVKIEKAYRFANADGELSFADLFAGYSQLAVYHLMFGPGWDEPCMGCSQWADALNGTTGSFDGADARLIAVSRAPFEEIAPVAERRGWSFTWLSSYGSEFNYDFYASSEDTGPDGYEQIGGEGGETVGFDRGENHGASAFEKHDDGSIYHTYSVYNRGIEVLNGAFGYYDMLPKGRPW
jgi:predicted dithiol-disulfide oxidoreductase (DUF899 family)